MLLQAFRDGECGCNCLLNFKRAIDAMDFGGLSELSLVNASRSGGLLFRRRSLRPQKTYFSGTSSSKTPFTGSSSLIDPLES
jgi:hypothetical protein